MNEQTKGPQDARRRSDDLRRWREEQYARRARSQAWLMDRESGGSGRLQSRQLRDLPRPARCGWPLTGTSIRLHDGKAYISGTERCVSPWACPICTPIIRTRRAKDLRTTIERWRETAEHGLWFLTLTIPHHKTDPLDTTLPIVSNAWSLMRGSQAWRRYARDNHIEHYVRAMEVTWSPQHGWHPHLHILLFTSTNQSPDRKSIISMWTATLQSIAPNRKTPSKRHGVLIEPANGSTALADYLSKTPDKRRDIASEVVRGDRKQSRRNDGVNPLQLLDDAIIQQIGLDMAKRLWAEYVDATYRRRTITWSRDLRRDMGIGSEEPTDEQIIQRSVHGIPVIDLTTEAYRMLRATPAIHAYVLQRVEDGEIPVALQVIDECTTPRN